MFARQLHGSTMGRRALRAVSAALALLAAAAAAAAQIGIVTPTAQQTLHDNAGNVEVRVAAAPEPARGEQVEVWLDGQLAARGAQTEFSLGGVERGEHTLQVRLVDRDGRTLAVSQPLTFHLWQASRLFPNRRSAR
jgi:hypothetical protein